MPPGVRLRTEYGRSLQGWGRSVGWPCRAGMLSKTVGLDLINMRILACVSIVYLEAVEQTPTVFLGVPV